jgi:hypothetical protein
MQIVRVFSEQAVEMELRRKKKEKKQNKQNKNNPGNRKNNQNKTMTGSIFSYKEALVRKKKKTKCIKTAVNQGERRNAKIYLKLQNASVSR